MEYKFKPFDRVLVRNDNLDEWRIDLFSNLNNDVYKYRCMAYTWKQCIPYEGNEWLLGRNCNPETKHEYQWGEHVEVCSLTEWIEAIFIGKEKDGSFRTVLQTGIVFVVPKQQIRPLKEVQ